MNCAATLQVTCHTLSEKGIQLCVCEGVGAAIHTCLLYISAQDAQNMSFASRPRYQIQMSGVSWDLAVKKTHGDVWPNGKSVGIVRIFTSTYY